MIYRDSSALAEWVVTGEETVQLQDGFHGRESEVVTCVLALTEILRVVRRSWYDSQRRLHAEADVLDRRLTQVGEILDWVDRVVVDTDTFL